MNSDNKNIKKLYDFIHKTDYFVVDKPDFIWEDFIKIDEEFSNLNSMDIYDYVLESFDRIHSNITTKDGTEDVYKIVLHNGKTFQLHLNYVNGKSAKSSIDKKRVNAEYKKDNILATEYKKHFATINDSEYICIIMFKDEMGRFERTGEIQMYAKELFITLKNAILDRISIRNNMRNIKAFMVRVDKKDNKRLDFYKFLFNKFLTEFNIHFEDKLAEEDNILLFAVKE